MSAFVDKTERPVVIIGAAAAYVLLWTFLAGGIIDRLARDHATRAYGFFSASGVFFFRFLRLGIIAAAAYSFLVVYVHQWLFAKWYVNATRDLSVEHTVFYWRLLMYAIFGGLLALTTTIFDYAKVRAVVEDRRSMIGALSAALRFLARNPRRVAALYAANAAAFLVVLAAWALVAPGAGGTGFQMWVAFIASQCYVLARLVVKLQFMASETALFQRSLAHWGYTAAPLVVTPEPPIVEIL